MRGKDMVDVVDQAGVVDVSSALEALRDQLEEAWLASQGRRVRFRVSDVRLTIQAVARREKEAGGKLRWWLIEAGAEGRAARESTQTLVLTLTPGVYEDDDQPSPLDVHGKESAPGD
jgi:Trypsin-co-occurring domain 2